ncbi:MAG: hypothetical protein U1F66_08620 [bacterium]
MRNRVIQFATAALLLSACAGVTGGGASNPGAAPGGAGAQDHGVGGADALVGPPPQVVAQASGEGTLGSQSSNVDIAPGFYREFTLFFQGETPDQAGAGYPYFLTSSPGSPPDGWVKRVKQYPQYQETACPDCAGDWIRAVNCGPYDDSDIDALIPEAEKNTPLGVNKLLWFLIHMPRSNDANGSVTVCTGAKYRDFPITQGGAVDLSKLEVYPKEIVVFYYLDANPPAEVGPLATGGYQQIPKEGIAASAAQHGLVRFLRPEAPLKISPQYFQQLKLK